MAVTRDYLANPPLEQPRGGTVRAYSNTPPLEQPRGGTARAYLPNSVGVDYSIDPPQTVTAVDTYAIVVAASSPAYFKNDIVTVVDGKTLSAALSRAYNDTVSATDTRLTALGHVVVKADAVTAVDAYALALGHFFTKNDTVAANDNYQTAATHAITKSDTLSAVDSFTNGSSHIFTEGDQVTAVDAKTLSLGHFINETDTVTAVDAAKAIQGILKPDAVTAVDVYTVNNAHFFTKTDVVTAIDTYAVRQGVYRPETVLAADTYRLNAALVRSYADTVSAVDAAASRVTYTRLDSVTAVDTYQTQLFRNFSVNKSDSVSAVDTYTELHGGAVNKADLVNALDAYNVFFRTASIGRTEVISVADPFIKAAVYIRSFADAVTPVDTYNEGRQHLQAAGETVTATDTRSLALQRLQVVADSVSIAEARTVGNVAQRVYPETPTAVDTVTLLRAQARGPYVDAVSTTDAESYLRSEYRRYDDTVVALDQDGALENPHIIPVLPLNGAANVLPQQAIIFDLDRGLGNEMDYLGVTIEVNGLNVWAFGQAQNRWTGQTLVIPHGWRYTLIPPSGFAYNQQITVQCDFDWILQPLRVFNEVVSAVDTRIYVLNEMPAGVNDHDDTVLATDVSLHTVQTFQRLFTDTTAAVDFGGINFVRGPYTDSVVVGDIRQLLAFSHFVTKNDTSIAVDAYLTNLNMARVKRDITQAQDYGPTLTFANYQSFIEELSVTETRRTTKGKETLEYPAAVDTVVLLVNGVRSRYVAPKVDVAFVRDATTMAKNGITINNRKALNEVRAVDAYLLSLNGGFRYYQSAADLSFTVEGFQLLVNGGRPTQLRSNEVLTLHETFLVQKNGGFLLYRNTADRVYTADAYRIKLNGPTPQDSVVAIDKITLLLPTRRAAETLFLLETRTIQKNGVLI